MTKISELALSRETAVVQLPSRLGVLEATDFKQACQQLLQNNPPLKRIICDFTQTTFIDSSGIGALVSNHKQARQKEVELVLKDINAQVMAVLVMTGLDEVFTLEFSPKKVVNSSKFTNNCLPTTHLSVRSHLKRCLDIVGGLVGLAITATLFIPIAIAIKLDSPGPIFFSQTRLGWMGKPFQILKFRSMVVNAEVIKDQIPNQVKGAIFKNDDDPRITRVGRFLRRTSLDELPQFWNVLKGEMSLVGTRPPLPREVEIYQIPEWQRLDVKPGMTGEWQVSGRSTIRDFEDIIKLDLRYQKNWSLTYDIGLIVKTVLVLFDKKSGAV